MFLPVLVEPLDLFGSELRRERLAVKARVLGVIDQVGGDVDPEPHGVHREQAVVEEPMDVPAQHQPAVIVVLPELGVAVQVPCFKDTRGSGAGKGAVAPLAGENVLPELPLSSAASSWCRVLPRSARSPRPTSGARGHPFAQLCTTGFGVAVRWVPGSDSDG